MQSIPWVMKIILVEVLLAHFLVLSISLSLFAFITISRYFIVVVDW